MVCCKWELFYNPVHEVLDESHNLLSGLFSSVYRRYCTHRFIYLPIQISLHFFSILWTFLLWLQHKFGHSYEWGVKSLLVLIISRSVLSFTLTYIWKGTESHIKVHELLLHPLISLIRDSSHFSLPTSLSHLLSQVFSSP